MQLNTSSVFADAPGYTGMHWRNLCAAENALAEMLAPLAKGTVATVGNDAWYLGEQEGSLVLFHGLLEEDLDEVHDPMSRFEHSLEWVDISDEDLEAYVKLVERAMEEFRPVYLESVAALTADNEAERPGVAP